MSNSEKLFASRLTVSVGLVLFALVCYVILAVYSEPIQEKITKLLVDSFGHLEGELALR